MKIAKFNKLRNYNNIGSIANYATTSYIDKIASNITTTNSGNLNNLKDTLTEMGIDTDDGTINITNGSMSTSESWKFSNEGKGSVGGFLFDKRYMVSQYGFNKDKEEILKQNITDEGTPNLIMDGQSGEIDITSPNANTLKIADINLEGSSQTTFDFDKKFYVNNFFENEIPNMTLVWDAGNNGELNKYDQPRYQPSKVLTDNTNVFNDTVVNTEKKSVIVKKLVITHPLILRNDTDKIFATKSTAEAIYFQDIYITIKNNTTNMIVWDGKIYCFKEFTHHGTNYYYRSPQYTVTPSENYESVKTIITSLKMQKNNSADWDNEDTMLFSLYLNDVLAANSSYTITYKYGPLYFGAISLRFIPHTYTSWYRKYKISGITTTTFANTSIISTQGIKYGLGENTKFEVTNNNLQYTNSNSGLVVEDGIAYRQIEGVKAPLSNSSVVVKIYNNNKDRLYGKRFYPNGKVETFDLELKENTTKAYYIEYKIQPFDEIIIAKGEKDGFDIYLRLIFPKTTIGRKVYWKCIGNHFVDLWLAKEDEFGTITDGIITANTWDIAKAQSTPPSRFWLFDGEDWITFNCS